jgi:hypothetical protein
MTNPDFVGIFLFRFTVSISLWSSKGAQKEGCTPLKTVPCGDSSLRLA